MNKAIAGDRPARYRSTADAACRVDEVVQIVKMPVVVATPIAAVPDQDQRRLEAQPRLNLMISGAI